MKQLRVLLLLLLFLQSKIGVAFNVHYCGGHIAKISWAFDAKDGGMEKKKFWVNLKRKVQKFPFRCSSIYSKKLLSR